MARVGTVNIDRLNRVLDEIQELDKPSLDVDNVTGVQYMWSMTEQEVWKHVYDELTSCPMFCGVYDAKNGSEEFMHGIQTVMEHIAFNADCYDEFVETFVNNMDESERKYEQTTEQGCRGY